MLNLFLIFQIDHQLLELFIFCRAYWDILLRACENLGRFLKCLIAVRSVV